jgi:PleD family two-component response regulator
MKKLSILILADEQVGVQHLQDALQHIHSITWTKTIAEALKHLEESRFEVIICGTHLVDESMFDFLSQVKRKAQIKSLPFICFRAGGSAIARDTDAALQYASELLGASDYIVCSTITRPETLRNRIESVMVPLTGSFALA